VVGSRAALSECPTRSSTQPALAQRRRRHQIEERDRSLDIKGAKPKKQFKRLGQGLLGVDVQ
jgi:hypothetical protein